MEVFTGWARDVDDMQAAVDDGLIDSVQGVSLINQILDVSQQLALEAVQGAIDSGKITAAMAKLAEGNTLRSLPVPAFKDAAVCLQRRRGRGRVIGKRLGQPKRSARLGVVPAALAAISLIWAVKRRREFRSTHAFPARQMPLQVDPDVNGDSGPASDRSATGAGRGGARGPLFSSRRSAAPHIAPL